MDLAGMLAVWEQIFGYRGFLIGHRPRMKAQAAHMDCNALVERPRSNLRRVRGYLLGRMDLEQGCKSGNPEGRHLSRCDIQMPGYHGSARSRRLLVLRSFGKHLSSCASGHLQGGAGLVAELAVHGRAGCILLLR